MDAALRQIGLLTTFACAGSLALAYLASAGNASVAPGRPGVEVDGPAVTGGYGRPGEPSGKEHS